jgi:hypothetical protein
LAYYSVTASTDLTTKGRFLRAFNVSETAGAAAIVNIRDGGVGGTIVLQLRFAAVVGGSTQTMDFDQPGICFPSGVYVEKNAGTIQAMVEIR